MTASSHTKFLFDLDLSLDPVEVAQQKAQAEAELQAERERAEAVQEAEPEIPTFSEEDVQRARDEGYQAGQTDTTRDLASAIEQRLAKTLDTINTQITNLFDAYARDKEEHSRDAVAVATVIVRKLFPALNMDTTMAEIEYMIIEAMQRTSGSPTLVVRVPADIHASVETKASQLAAVRGREGTVTVMIDDAMSEGDVAVEWDGGGMTRDTQAMWQEIDQIIERNLGAKRTNNHKEALQSAPQAETTPPTAQQPERPKASQEVVNEASVGENEENAPESVSEATAEAENTEQAGLESAPTAPQTPSSGEEATDKALDKTPAQDTISGTDTPDGTEHES